MKIRQKQKNPLDALGHPLIEAAKEGGSVVLGGFGVGDPTLGRLGAEVRSKAER